MEFIGPNGKPVLLQGMPSYAPHTISAHRMEVDLRQEDIEWVVELRIYEAGGQPKPLHPEIQAILDKYLVVFGDIVLCQPPDQGFQHTMSRGYRP